MYENMTDQIIKNRMLNNISNDLSKQEGTLTYDAISPVSIELALAYAELERTLNLGFAQTASGQYLDYRAGEHGVFRKPATKAHGDITFIGTDETVIAKNTIIATVEGTQFYTTVDSTIVDGTVIVPIESIVDGIIGNVPANSITVLPIAIAGVTSLTNVNSLDNAVDIETDTSLLERLLEKVQKPSTSGNKYHYLQWAKEVAGVGDAKVFPLWNGALTVKCVIIDTDKTPANAELVQKCYDHIEEVRPIGADVTVISATGIDINVTANITLAQGYSSDGVKTIFESKVVEYLKNIAFEKSFVSYAQIGALLLSAEGVIDYADLLVNGDVANIAIDEEQIAIKGMVNLNG